MKKKLQQWAALCLTLALAFCLALPVWADEPEAQKITSATKGNHYPYMERRRHRR